MHNLNHALLGARRAVPRLSMAMQHKASKDLAALGVHRPVLLCLLHTSTTWW